jgi:centrosomal protein CEP290
VLGNQFSSGGPISRDQLVQAHKKIGNLQVQLDICDKRTELAEHKWKMTEQVEVEIKSRLNAVDKLYLETMEENMSLRDAEMELRNSYEGGANREENSRNLDYIAKLEQEAEKLRSDTLKAESRSEIATQQASDLIRIHAIDEKEKKILRAGMQELQMEGDEKLLIGKLHNHVVALQISEANCGRKLEMMTTKCLKLESNVVQLERLVEMRDTKVFQMHLDSKNRVRILQGIVSDLRARMSGVVLLTKHEVRKKDGLILSARAISCNIFISVKWSQTGIYERLCKRRKGSRITLWNHWRRSRRRISLLSRSKTNHRMLISL